MAKSKKPRKAYKPKGTPLELRTSPLITVLIDDVVTDLIEEDVLTPEMPSEEELLRIGSNIQAAKQALSRGVTTPKDRGAIVTVVCSFAAGIQHGLFEDESGTLIAAANALYSAYTREHKGLGWGVTGPERHALSDALDAYMHIVMNSERRIIDAIEKSLHKTFTFGNGCLNDLLNLGHEQITTNPSNQLESSPGSNRSGRVEPVHNQLLVA